jgi:hypothetical protein
VNLELADRRVGVARAEQPDHLGVRDRLPVPPRLGWHRLRLGELPARAASRESVIRRHATRTVRASIAISSSSVTVASVRCCVAGSHQ